MTASQRPMGVTMLARLAIIGGGIEVLLAVISLLTGGATFFDSLAKGSHGSYAHLAYAHHEQSVAFGLVFLAGISAILGILNLIFGFGALALKPWAWKFGVGIQFFAVLFGLFQLPKSIVGIVINGLILRYLFQPKVKRIFGRG